jgi:hypothetical protein
MEDLWRNIDGVTHVEVGGAQDSWCGALVGTAICGVPLAWSS